MNFVVEDVCFHMESKCDDVSKSNMFKIEPKDWI